MAKAKKDQNTAAEEKEGGKRERKKEDVRSYRKIKGERRPNPLQGLRVDAHVLQSFPPSCLNRDDTNSPKSCMLGGSKRAMNTPQCQKRPIRLAFHEFGVKTGVRTREMDDILYDVFLDRGMPEADARELAFETGKVLGNTVLLFFTEKEIEIIADFVLEKGSKPDIKKDAPKLAEAIKGVIGVSDGLDIALFGRMVAQTPYFNVTAAVSVAPAISTHRVNNETDFFTAVDDIPREGDAGAGYLDVSEFNAATYYRYVSVDLGQLAENLSLETNPETGALTPEGAENLSRALEYFIRAFYKAIPSGKQKAMAAHRPWDYAHFQLRKGHGMQASFEKDVYPKYPEERGFLEPSIRELERQLETNRTLAGSMYGLLNDFIYGEGHSNIDEIVDGIRLAVMAQIKA